MKHTVVVASSERASLPRLVGELLFRNWGLKAIALVLTAITFVSTRDEVTRGYTVPLKVVDDPQRVLLTELPGSIQVQARGPWTRMSRLQDYDFGVATLDLKNAGPGPLDIDRAAIVMPSGVVLANIDYDHVDLRFDEIIEQDVEVEPPVVGRPAPDYELIRVEVQPTRWPVRGGASFVRAVARLSTETVEIEGAREDVVVQRSIVDPSHQVDLVATDGAEAAVTVRAIINPRTESRRLTLAVAKPEGLDPTGVIPASIEVEVGGSIPDWRTLDGLGLSRIVRADAVRVEGHNAAEIRLSWLPSVPQPLQQRLVFDPKVNRFDLPIPPSTQTAVPGPTTRDDHG